MANKPTTNRIKQGAACCSKNYLKDLTPKTGIKRDLNIYLIKLAKYMNRRPVGSIAIWETVARCLIVQETLTNLVECVLTGKSEMSHLSLYSKFGL